MIRIIFIVCAAYFVSGCAQTMKIKANPTAGQQIVYENGKELIVSKKVSALAVASLTRTIKSNQRPRFIITYFNGASVPLNLSTENILATFNGYKAKIYTYEELVEEIESNRRSQALSAALVGASQMMNASGTQYHSGSYNTNYYGSGGSGYGYGTYSGTTYDPTAAAQAQAVIQSQTMSNINSANTSAANALNELDRVILRAQTVMPQQYHGGYIVLQKLPVNKTENKLSLVINTDNESHTFNYIIETLEN